MKRSGFTLVELLVVVAIIALLISILAPSLRTAKDLAKQVICGTNLRAIAVATSLYAEANRGNLPKVTGTLDARGLAEPYAWPVNLVSDGSGRNTPYGMGHFHFNGLISSDVMYCPLYAAQPGAAIKWVRKGYPDPYGLNRAGDTIMMGTVNFFCGYMWNVSLAVPPVCPRGTKVDQTYGKIEQIPSGGFVAMDLYLTPGEIGHWLAGPTTPSWQVAHAGGGVQLKQCPDGYTYMQNADMDYLLTDYAKGLEYIQGKL